MPELPFGRTRGIEGADDLRRLSCLPPASFGPDAAGIGDAACGKSLRYCEKACGGSCAATVNFQKGVEKSILLPDFGKCYRGADGKVNEG